MSLRAKMDAQRAAYVARGFTAWGSMSPPSVPKHRPRGGARRAQERRPNRKLRSPGTGAAAARPDSGARASEVVDPGLVRKTIARD